MKGEWQPKRGEPVWVLLSSSSPRKEWYMGVIGYGKMGRFHFPVRIMVNGKWMSRFIWWDSRLMEERENDTQSIQRAGIQQSR